MVVDRLSLASSILRLSRRLADAWCEPSIMFVRSRRGRSIYWTSGDPEGFPRRTATIEQPSLRNKIMGGPDFDIVALAIPGKSSSSQGLGQIGHRTLPSKPVSRVLHCPDYKGEH